MMSEENTQEAEVEEVAEEKLSFRQILTSLRAAFEGGAISKDQYKRMRAESGMPQSYFTRKQFNRKKARHKDKLQKQARKATRATLKGQKNHKGMKR